MEAVESNVAPVPDWMALALQEHPGDLEALGRISPITLQRECFNCLKDYRERGAEVIQALRDAAQISKGLGRKAFGGIRLVGAVWNCGAGIEMANETGLFYILPLSILHPELAGVLTCDGKHATALRDAGWKP